MIVIISQIDLEQAFASFEAPGAYLGLALSAFGFRNLLKPDVNKRSIILKGRIT